jgi:hypothetical protein
LSNKPGRVSGWVAKLANGSVIHIRDLNSNLGIDRNCFLVLFVTQNMCVLKNPGPI